jgi:hypothetical protein
MYIFRIVIFTIINSKIVFYFLYDVGDGLPIASFGAHHWFPQMRKDWKDNYQTFECRHGECTYKFKNSKNLRGHMKKKHNLFIELTDPGKPETIYCVRIQDRKKMNSKIMGDV